MHRAFSNIIIVCYALPAAGGSCRGRPDLDRLRCEFLRLLTPIANRHSHTDTHKPIETQIVCGDHHHHDDDDDTSGQSKGQSRQRTPKAISDCPCARHRKSSIIPQSSSLTRRYRQPKCWIDSRASVCANQQRTPKAAEPAILQQRSNTDNH